MSQLREQDHLFTVLEKGADGNQPIVIGAVHECLNARLDSLAAIIEKFCEPQVAIVSLTITEKGYCIDPATGKLDPTHPRIIHDLENPTLPQSAPGILVEALARRRERGLPPFTVLSCDNIPDNGHVVKMPSSAWRKNAARRWRTGSPTTSASRAPWWIALFPRPHRSRWRKSPPCWGRRSLRHQLRTLHSVGGRRSLCRRATRRETAGVQMTDDVLPEQMKLRMLNGSHSFLAWLGYLAGHAHISDCMRDEVFRRAARQLMLDEQAPTLTITGVDLLAYADSLIARFSNPALKHRTWQIAMDGSQKLPQRMLDGIRVHLARDSRWPLLALGVAGWMRYVSGTDDAGQTIDVRDPLVDKIRQRVAQSDEQQRVDALLGLEEIFGRDLPHNAQFVAGIRAAWQQLATHGAREAVARALNS